VSRNDDTRAELQARFPSARSLATVGAVSGTTVECANCGAAIILQPNQRTAKCLYCGSPTVADRPTSPDRPRPIFAIGFVVPNDRALEIARRWIRRPFFAPSAFRRAVPSEIRGLYLPAYLYSAAAFCDWAAQIGENYTVTESYTTTDAQGRSVTSTRTRVETEWRALGGKHAAYVSDRVVTASRGIGNDELEAIEPFDLRALRRYSPEIISGWAAEEPSLSHAECVELARGEAVAQVGALLGTFMPGDSHRELRYRTWLEREDLSLTLLPIWVLPVRYAPDKPLVRLLVNGQTGKLYGKAPLSKLKVALAIVFIVALVTAPVIAALVAAGAFR
jgi:hypothetical protein